MTAATVPQTPVAREADGAGPLAGVRVIELGMLLAGPFTGRLLGDMGAEIIKIEPPGQPDPLRDSGKARYKGRSLWWPVQSRNKKCCTLNLRTETGQRLLLDLVRHTDVLVEIFINGSPGEPPPRMHISLGDSLAGMFAARGIHARGIVPKFSDTPGSVRWSGTWVEGSHNREVYGGLLGLSDERLGELRAEGLL